MINRGSSYDAAGQASGDEMTEASTFAASDGLSLAYYIDDFTDPWRNAPTL